ncbi:MAG TPA: hypothetical protein DE179_13335, partial [Oceanospirillaceae bacterium]|nr:hypothetical protein [Oceanospirillaceae bacterium]
MKLDHTYVLPVILALGVHIVAALIFATEWQGASERKPPLPVQQQVQATLIDLDSIIAMQKQQKDSQLQADAKKKADAK